MDEAGATEMKKDSQLTIRLEPDVAERAEALSKALHDRPEFKAFRMTRAAVMRMAMLEGLATLEQRYLAEATKEKSKR